MCGLVGLIARKPAGFFHGDMGFLENLLLLDTIRGPDSTGVFTVLKDGSVSINKVGSHPLHLFASAGWGKFRQKMIQTGRIAIGHNRKATAGAINSKNAHPFHENNIVLVHNGTVRGSHRQMADTEVDSHAICHAFNEKGAEEVIKTLDAAFAFIWYDIAANKLFAVRNTERPLSIVVTDDLYVVCSEPWMAQGLLGREGKKIQEIIHLDSGMLYEWDERGGMKSKTIELRKETPIKQFEYSDYNLRWARHSVDGLDDDLDDLPSVGTRIKSKPDTPFHNAAASMLTKFEKDDNFPKDSEVLVKITSADKSPTGLKMKLTGKVIEPGKPHIDVVGYHDAAEIKDVMHILGQECIATITGYTKSTCGPSLWVTDIKPSPMIETWTGEVPEKVWNYIVANVSCRDCNSHLHMEDHQFCSFSHRPNKTYRVLCADCVEAKLPKGTIQNDFTQRRLDALQDGVTVCKEPPSSSLKLIASDGKTTLH